MFLDINHCPVYISKQCFGDWIKSLSSGKPTQLGPVDRTSPADSILVWVLYKRPK
jgi:hypothetical protein